MNKFILDSYALLCLFDGKRQNENKAIKKLLESADHNKISLYMSKMNEGEVYYKLCKYIGKEIALGFRADIKRGIFPIQIVPVNDRRVDEASAIKAEYNISYADAFCIGLAKEMGLPVITGDPEFDAVKDIIRVKSLLD